MSIAGVYNSRKDDVPRGYTSRRKQRTMEYRNALPLRFDDSPFGPPAMTTSSTTSNQAGRLAVIAAACLAVAAGAAAVAYYNSAAEPVTPPATGAPKFTGQRHPLDDAIEYAEERRQQMQAAVRGYTAVVAKRERIGGKLLEEKMEVKILNRKTAEDGSVSPLSVYLKFIEPKSKKGREVIYVENRNEGKLVAHEGGLLNIMRANLQPDGQLAMMGNRYPITEIGLANLADKLVERGKVDRQWDGIEVDIREEDGPGDRPCKLIEIRHLEQWPEFDFFLAKIYIDLEYNVPVRYSAYTWPTQPGGPPVLEEEYIYTSVKLNPGLTANDFDPENKAYQFP